MSCGSTVPPQNSRITHHNWLEDIWGCWQHFKSLMANKSNKLLNWTTTSNNSHHFQVQAFQFWKIFPICFKQCTCINEPCQKMLQKTYWKILNSGDPGMAQKMALKNPLPCRWRPDRSVADPSSGQTCGPKDHVSCTCQYSCWKNTWKYSILYRFAYIRIHIIMEYYGSLCNRWIHSSMCDASLANL